MVEKKNIKTIDNVKKEKVDLNKVFYLKNPKLLKDKIQIFIYDDKKKIMNYKK
jgi:hypothetical protein